MGTFSVWHWSIVLLVVGVPVWLLVRYFRRRRTGLTNAPLTGIGGWLAFLAFGLCVGFVRNVADFVQAMPEYLSGFQNLTAHGQLVVIGLVSFACLAANLWAIVALFQKKRNFKTAYLILWALTVLTPLSLLYMLTVPGVTLEMVLPSEDIGRTVAAVIAMGLWYWYLCASVRVKNTLIN